MDLKIIEVVSDNSAEGEFVLLEVLQDSGLEGYELHDETYNHQETQSVNHHLFRFPDREVRKGDFIRVYTCDGKQQTIVTNVAVHCFYRGLSEKLWKSA